MNVELSFSAAHYARAALTKDYTACIDHVSRYREFFPEDTPDGTFSRMRHEAEAINAISEAMKS